ncbi:MAG: hypothetical protein IT453_04260 [Planctomycetes bacterium]|nr:hypothetical protein [Planctomycetota bacterium]
MNTFLARCTALALGSSIAVVGGLLAATCLRIEPLSGPVCGAWRTVLPDVEMRLATQGELRDSAARAEVVVRGDLGWPGAYRTVGIWPTELVLAPRAGFTLFHHSRCGNCDGFAAFGRVTAASEPVLQLDIELSHACTTTSEHLADRLYTVRWGELLFVVTPQRAERFCAAVTDGRSFPGDPVRVLGDTAFDFDAPTRPEGRPLAPSEWQRWLPAAPIEARIVRLVELRPLEPDPNSSVTYYDAEFELDRGAADGVAVGLSMFAAPPPGRDERRGRIESVDEHSARLVLLTKDDQRAWAESLVGTAVSTLHPLAPRPSR